MNAVKRMMMVCRNKGVLVATRFVLLLALLVNATAGYADCTEWIAKAVSIQGRVEVRPSGKAVWAPVKLHQAYCHGDTIRVQANSRAALELHNDTILRLNQSSTLILSGPKKESSWLDLLKGSLHSISRVPRSLKIKTPFVNAAVEGTEFLVQVDSDNTLVGVIEGKVAVANEYGRILLAKDQSAITYKGKAPVLRLDIRPADSVQWSLYYPSLNVAALKPAEELLRVGQVEAAQALLQGQSGAEALALQSIIAIAGNKKADALSFAEQAVKTDSSSAAAHLAHSYALQASFDLSAAKAAVQQAVKEDASHAMAWARLAELHLSLAELDEGMAAAKRAVELQPSYARTQTILGFAHLLQYETAQAKQAFKRSIELDSSDPLARLGNGLATIREGDLQQGRREIEIAASLDTNNAQVRSYLGKAYLEEKRNKLAADQFALAKQMDPKDPTPWFYDAVRKQGDNDPIGALQDLEKSRALNDNRAVFRSKQLLDQDAAIRSTSVARIYNTLGAEQRALQNAWSSLSSDPANASAHRFLADSYARLPRHKIAQVSELLQSQLLQPLNANPVQPQLAERSLGIPDGNETVNSFGEYNPLFTQEGVNVQTNLLVGSRDTLAEDLAVSGIHGSFAYSLGQFHYETDGFRDNNDLKQDLYNVFIQSAISPATDIQAEYRHVESEFGDLDLKVDRDNFSTTENNDRSSKLARIGVHHKLSANKEMLVSLVHKDLEFQKTATTTRQLNIGGPVLVDELRDSETRLDSTARYMELQALNKTPKSSYIFGLGYFDEDQQVVTSEVITLAGFMFPPSAPIITDVDARYANAYLYANRKLARDMMLTLGASYDDLSSSSYDSDEINPKLGVIWTGEHGTSLRAAYFEGVTRPINAEQTIEPTQVAGFNQFFDDTPGSATRRYGVGIDQAWGNKVSAGMEVSWRQLESPFGSIIEKRDEKLHRAYMTWIPAEKFLLNAEYFYEVQEGQLTFPDKMVTHIAPISMRYFWSGGNFVGLTGTYIDQRVNHSATSVAGSDEFWLADMSIGVRLPKRQGIFQLDVKNLFNKSFSYQMQDRDSIARAVISPRFIPERQIFARFSLAF